MADAGGGTDAAAKGDAVEKFQHDDVARLSSAVLRPLPDAASKHTWLSELGTSVAARVRDCLHCGSGSAVRKLLTQTDTELDIHVRETLTPKLIKEVAEGRLDTAIVALPVSEPSLTEVALFSENFLLVRPGEDASTPVPSAEMLREMRLLLLEEGHCFRDQALSFCNMQSSPPREVLDASSLSTLVQMVGAGIGVTLIPEMAVTVETRSAPVTVSRFKHPQPSRTIGMVWRKTSPLAPQLQQIADVVSLAARELRAPKQDGAKEPAKRAGRRKAG